MRALALTLALIGVTFACDCNEDVQRLTPQQKFCYLPYVLHLDVDNAKETTEGHKLDRHIDYEITVHKVIQNTRYEANEERPRKMKSFTASALCGIKLTTGEYVLSGGLNKNGVFEVNHCEMIEKIDDRRNKLGKALLETDCSKVPNPGLKLHLDRHH
ncbi:unnamed protein product, partial [Mesorhabditis belari]|uniref:NTR domain-containing protein n=1 Tax=Mesorhabditis belari TaxID=2138241 RepID=A0AAF3E9C0_9BILA